MFVFQEVYETLLYLFTPFVLPISFIVRPAFSAYLFAGTFAFYFAAIIIFNEVHLRLKRERVSYRVILLYYMPYKLILTAINVGSCYWSLYSYAKYFARRHPKIIEDEKAVDIVLRMEESSPTEAPKEGGRRMSVTAIGSQLHGFVVDNRDSTNIDREARLTITTLGPTLAPTLSRDNGPLSPVAETSEAAPMPSMAVPFAAPPTRTTSASVSPSQPAFTFATGRALSRKSSDHPSPLRRPDPVAGRTSSSLHRFASHPGTAEQQQQQQQGGVRASSSTHPSRRQSMHSRTSSRRRSRSQERGAARTMRADFESPSFGDLMDRLTGIEHRLNHGGISTLDVEVQVERPRLEIEGQRAPVVVAGSSAAGGARGLRTMDRLNSVDDGDVDVDVDEKLEFEKDDDRRTSDSQSMV